ncbi:hypothetical protein ACROYT_G015198 [Oculina patagonica]
MSGENYIAVLEAVLSILPDQPKGKTDHTGLREGDMECDASGSTRCRAEGMLISLDTRLAHLEEEFGLQEAYKNDRGTNKFLRRLMALPYLPAEKIPRKFKRLKQEASVRAVKKMVKYVEENWISSEFFPPTSWSMFKQVVRTNNGLEGRHNGLNQQAKGKAQLPLHTLIKLQHDEALLVMVSDKRLKRHQHKTSTGGLCSPCQAHK